MFFRLFCASVIQVGEIRQFRRNSIFRKEKWSATLGTLNFSSWVGVHATTIWGNLPSCTRVAYRNLTDISFFEVSWILWLGLMICGTHVERSRCVGTLFEKVKRRLYEIIKFSFSTSFSLDRWRPYNTYMYFYFYLFTDSQFSEQTF